MEQMKTINSLINRALLTSVLGLAGALVFVGAAHAQTATDNLEVSAIVSDNCSISAGSIDFGAYDPVTTNAETALVGQGTLSVTCTSGAATTITLSEGANADTGSDPALPLRRMVADTVNFLDYSLYSDEPQTLIWGVGETVDVEHVGTGVEEPFTIYGSVAPGQNVPSGLYADTVVATVNF